MYVCEYGYPCAVAATPTAVTVNRIGYNSGKVSWTAPSPAPAGYEVFYQTIGESAISGGNTSNTELTLTWERHTLFL